LLYQVSFTETVLTASSHDDAAVSTPEPNFQADTREVTFFNNTLRSQYPPEWPFVYQLQQTLTRHLS
jgi:hypothetical protein